ncbi:MAG: urease accessory protein UreE [Pseudomonadota bacterium]
MNEMLETCSAVLGGDQSRANGPVADTITLDETDRHRRRIKMVSDGGIAFLLDLPHARLLRHGDILCLSDGRAIEVRAKPEALYDIVPNNPRHLVSLAWQIGNRHLAAEISENSIRIRRDPVIKKMLEGLEAQVVEIEAPFNPEAGAYSGGGHSHDHHHGSHTDD